MASILVVDDSALVRNMLSVLLTDVGHQVFEAINGEEALDKINEKTFDLVMTDVNMPIVDGIALCRELRQRADYRFTPVLIITTESSDEMKQQGKAAGATGWLVKPFDPQKLLHSVSLLCGRAS
ncbi:MAG: response regulator [Oceanospirillaceae bacterium]|nr:response regulator [Oceanospirillaceae bacterium]